MKIDNFRTAKFKNAIKQIAEVNGKIDKLSFNFDLGGNTKSIKVNGIEYDNCVAICWITEKLDSNRYIKRPIAITYGDYEQFVRDNNIKSVLGEEVELKDYRKTTIKKEAPVLNVGQIYYLRSYSNCRTQTSICRVVRTTKTTADVEVLGITYPDKYIPSGVEYSIQIPIKEIKISDYVIDSFKVRSNKYGYWTTPGYSCWYLCEIDSKTTYDESYQFD